MTRHIEAEFFNHILADILNVPFAVLDATKIFPTGFIGNDAEILLDSIPRIQTNFLKQKILL